MPMPTGFRYKEIFLRGKPYHSKTDDFRIRHPSTDVGKWTKIFAPFDALRRILDTLPADWGEGYENVHICCTCENQRMTDKRLPIYLELPLPNKSIIHEPMLEQINIRPYLEKYGPQISSVSCGGESGPEARICDYGWVLDTHMQCVE